MGCAHVGVVAGHVHFGKLTSSSAIVIDKVGARLGDQWGTTGLTKAVDASNTSCPPRPCYVVALFS